VKINIRHTTLIEVTKMKVNRNHMRLEGFLILRFLKTLFQLQLMQHRIWQDDHDCLVEAPRVFSNITYYISYIILYIYIFRQSWSL